MALNFSVTPTWVYPSEPEYHNITTQSEGMKKVRFNVSGNSVQTYRLVFEGMSDAQHTTLKSHYNSVLGDFYSFTWNSVPSYISGSSAFYGNWVKGSFKEKPNARYWECEIEFEIYVP